MKSRVTLSITAALLGVSLLLSGCATQEKAHSLTDVSSTSEHKTPRATPSPTPVVTTETVSSTEPIPFESTTVNDAARPQGQTAVTTLGVAGVMTTTYRVTMTDGVETSREQISQAVTTPPVTQVTSVGTYVKPPPPPPAAPVMSGGGATALCRDGTLSYAAHHQGACSWHGGVAQFYK